MSKRPTILAADDERGLRELFEFTLEPLGYDVTTVADGELALRAVRERAFDLVILDIHMPRLTGPDVLDGIRAVRPEQRCLVISAASETDNPLVERVHEAGVRCLFKPLEMDELVAEIVRAMTEGTAGGVS